MRILHVASWYVPGLGYEENYLPQAQTELGHTVAIATSKRVPFSFQNLEGARGGAPPDEDVSRTSPSPAILRLESASFPHGQLLLSGLRHAIRDFQPDVVHAHGAFLLPTLQCLLIQKREGFALVVDDHSHAHNVSLGGAIVRTYFDCLAAAYKLRQGAASAFLAVTPAARQNLLNWLRVPPDRIVDFSLGADISHFRPSSQERELGRRALGVVDERPIIVTTGKLGPQKRTELLIEAFGLVLKRRPDAMLVIAGAGSRMDVLRIRNAVDSMGLRGDIRFMGLVPHRVLPQFYNAADIGVWPGSHSITVLEAMASGLPCVIPEPDDAYRTVVEARTCFGFKAGDPASLAESIMKLLNRPELRERLSMRSTNYVRTELSPQKLAIRAIAVYESALSRPIDGQKAPQARLQ